MKEKIKYNEKRSIKKDEILINNLYNSNPKAYANEGKNIVHEIINLFKANNGKYYIYVVKDAMIKYVHNDRISDIILTRTVGNKMVEVLAWIKKTKQLIKRNKNKTRKFDINRLCKEQEKYLKDICYDINYKIRVDKIFNNNTYYYPNTYYINKKITNQSQKTYIGNDEEIVKELLNDNNGLWTKRGEEDDKLDIDNYMKREKLNEC